MNKREIGNDVEEYVVKYLSSKGIRIIDRNFYTKHGELDIIGMDDEYLVFFEVKYRKDGKYGNPLEAVTKKKIRNLYNASRIYLYLKHYPENTFIRFDCIGVSEGKIEWLKNAISF